MNVTYAEEAIADILDAIAYLNDRSPTAASQLDSNSPRALSIWPLESSTVHSRARSGSLSTELARFRPFASITSASQANY